MKLPEKIKEWWPLGLFLGLLGAIGWFGARLVDAVAAPFWAHIAPAIPQTALLSLCCLLVLAIVLLAAWIVYLHGLLREPSAEAKNKAFHDQFGEFLPQLGVWTHKTKPGYFCQNCKARHCESPMVEREHGWQCLVKECQYFAPNPNYKPPPEEGESQYVPIDRLLAALRL
jgi:hypothetical protein